MTWTEEGLLKRFQDIQADIQRDGLARRGMNELLKYCQGEDLTQREAIAAHCYECVGYGMEGKTDCSNPFCPLYPFNPYSSRKRVSRVLSEDHKEKLSKARDNSNALRKQGMNKKS